MTRKSKKKQLPQSAQEIEMDMRRIVIDTNGTVTRLTQADVYSDLELIAVLKSVLEAVQNGTIHVTPEITPAPDTKGNDTKTPPKK